MLCLQPNGRWKKTDTRCSYVINIVIIVIINNTLYWLAFTPGTSGAHMLGRRAPAACLSPVSLHTCKRGWADPAPYAALQCGAPHPAPLLLLLVLARGQPVTQRCWPSTGLRSIFPSGQDPFTHSPVLKLCIHMQP